MLTTFNQHENPVIVTIQLLKQLNVKVTSTAVNETILNPPDYPGLLCISDALKNWNIENVAKRIKADKLTELPAQIMAFTKSNGSYAAFAAKYPVNGELKMQDDKISSIKNGVLKQKSFTPAIFFNGYQLPDAYNISNLKYFLNELNMFCKTKAKPKTFIKE